MIGIADALSLGAAKKPGSRVYWLLCIVLLGIVLLTVIGFNLLADVKIGGRNYAGIKALRESLETGLRLKADLRQMRADEIELVNETDSVRIRQLQASLKRLNNSINDEFAMLSGRDGGQKFKSGVQEAQGKWSDLSSALTNEVIPAVQRADRTQGKALAMGTQKARYDQVSIQIDRLTDSLKAEIDKAEANANTFVGHRIFTAALSSLVVLLIVLFSIWYMIAAFRRSVTREVAFAQSLADGDLSATLEADSGGAFGDLSNALGSVSDRFKMVLENNQAVMKELKRISRTISDASTRVVKTSENKARRISETSAAIVEINATVKGVAQGIDSLSFSASENSSSILEMAASVEEVALNAETLAQSVEEVASSIVEMTASIKQIGSSLNSLIDASNVTVTSVVQMDTAIRQVEKSAKDTSAISDEVRRDAEIGKSSVDATIKGMQEIRRSSGITSEVINTLSQRANDIGAILSVIDEVAEQTNLLALNAAIIAAQAGDQGKGFAVVADEIKELADRTSVSTREISVLIEGVQEETRRAVEAIDQAEKSIADGELLSEKSGEALNKIVAGVQKATQQVSEIAQASMEQAKESQMIRDTVEQFTDMIMQISNATQEQNKGSELIMTAVERMKILTGQVRSSTREQSKVGNVIAKSTEDITSMIQQIKRACDEQAKGSEQIVIAVEDIQKSTDENLEAVKVLDDAFAGLSQQVVSLDKQAQTFKINA